MISLKSVIFKSYIHFRTNIQLLEKASDNCNRLEAGEVITGQLQTFFFGSIIFK
jgi:hypothetical protein